MEPGGTGGTLGSGERPYRHDVELLFEPHQASVGSLDAVHDLQLRPGQQFLQEEAEGPARLARLSGHFTPATDYGSTTIK